jgi:hypothetical protein
MYGIHGILAFTIELGQQFIVPEEEIIPMCKMHLGPNLLMAEVADNPWQHKLSIVHEPLNDTRSDKDYPVIVRVDAPEGLEMMDDGLVLHYSIDGGEYESVVMESTGTANHFIGFIPGQERDSYEEHNVSYYITVVDREGHYNSAPKYAPHDLYKFNVIPKVKYTPTVIVLLIIHILVMFGAILFVLIASGYGAWYLWKGTKFNRVLMHSGISTGLIFIGGMPLGWLLAWIVFGQPWFGIPFGWDMTDNKTLVIFLYWLFSLFFVKGSIMRHFSTGRGRFCPFRWCMKLTEKVFRADWFDPKRERKDLIERRGFVALVFISSFITIALYLVPHSIETSPWFSVFLFSLTGVTFGFVLIKIIQKRRTKAEVESSTSG